jgi:hypothetical protein
MILKCAEALALRAAFPNELGGVYTDDEMGQASSDADESDAAPAVEVRQLAPRTKVRSLDDVASPLHTARTEPVTVATKTKSTPAPARVVVDTVAEESDADESPALGDAPAEPPKWPCPIFQKGDRYQGKRWDEVPVGFIRKHYTTMRDRLTTPQLDWCRFILAEHARKKAAVLAAQGDVIAQAEEAGFSYVDAKVLRHTVPNG